MASMNRNLNLEEVNSDAFMGIPFLNHQTIIQKILFWGSVILCVAFNLLGNFYFELGSGVTSLITLIPLFFGVALGCNYNEDLSVLKYLILILSKPSKVYISKPTEDIEQLKKAEERVKRETVLMERQKTTPEQQKQLLIKLIAGIVAGIILLIILMIFIGQAKKEEVHHTIMGSDIYRNEVSV